MAHESNQPPLPDFNPEQLEALAASGQVVDAVAAFLQGREYDPGDASYPELTPMQQFRYEHLASSRTVQIETPEGVRELAAWRLGRPLAAPSDAPVSSRLGIDFMLGVFDAPELAAYRGLKVTAAAVVSISPANSEAADNDTEDYNVYQIDEPNQPWHGQGVIVQSRYEPTDFRVLDAAGALELRDLFRQVPPEA